MPCSPSLLIAGYSHRAELGCAPPSVSRRRHGIPPWPAAGSALLATARLHAHASSCPSRTKLGHRRSGLREDGGEAGKHFIHDGLRDGFEAFPIPDSEVEDARLVAADHAPRAGASAFE